MTNKPPTQWEFPNVGEIVKADWQYLYLDYILQPGETFEVGADIDGEPGYWRPIGSGYIGSPVYLEDLKYNWIRRPIAQHNWQNITGPLLWSGSDARVSTELPSTTKAAPKPSKYDDEGKKMVDFFFKKSWSGGVR